MDDNAKRIGSALFTGVIVIIWIALRADGCGDESSYDDYSYSSLPSFSYTPPTDYTNVLDGAKKAVDELIAQDAEWRAQVEMTDPIAMAANAKNTQCQALDAVIEQAPTWKVEVSEFAVPEGAVIATVAPYPAYLIHGNDGFPNASPEGIARSERLLAAIKEGSTPTVPKMTTTDMLIQTALMPKPAKGAKKVKGAIAPGTPIVKGWIFDHRENRVVCAGVRAIPGATKGTDALLLNEEQIAQLVRDVPSALKAIPLPDDAYLVEEPPPKKKKQR